MHQRKQISGAGAQSERRYDGDVSAGRECVARYASEELMEPQQEIISTSLSQRCRPIELEPYPLQVRSSFRLGYENNGSMDPNSLLKEGTI
jgi:hypothetical protein